MNACAAPANTNNRFLPGKKASSLILRRGSVIPLGMVFPNPDRSMRVTEGKPCFSCSRLHASHSLVQANGVALGLLDPAQHLFPDQTRQFADACETMIEAAMGRRIRVLTPLIEFSKSDVLAMARLRGLSDTYSCHAGGDTPCGLCVACVEIANAEKRR